MKKERRKTQVTKLKDVIKSDSFKTWAVDALTDLVIGIILLILDKVFN